MLAIKGRVHQNLDVLMFLNCIVKEGAYWAFKFFAPIEASLLRF
jgi:hypothetical protein